jgi:GMP synthase (glutamine-hydrolysing)
VRSPRCNQAFRLGEAAWGIQFHAEVTLETIQSWLADKDELPGGPDRDELLAECESQIGKWNELGRGLCGAFVEVAERAAVPA